ncbi:MAG: hypothetical protein KGL39_30525 [Patescibacteria group bacterium]|nr:hypothetical protein [Patescibacteria group bacterium]
MNIEVRDAPDRLSALKANLSDIIALPDPEAADGLNRRMAAHALIESLREHSYGERVVITREFEQRALWRYLEDPDTGQPFPNLTAWLSCSDYLGCRRVNFEALRTAKLLPEIPAQEMVGIPKANLQALTQISTAVRNQPDILEAARTLDSRAFEEKVEVEHPLQHIEVRKPMRFTPGRSWSKVIESALSYAVEHGIASTRDEALLRMAETALNEWQLEEELHEMVVEDNERTEGS